MPPDRERINEQLIGAPATTTQQKLAPRHSLVGYLGLRPAELAVLSVEGGNKAKAGMVKRNIQTMKQAQKGS